MKANVRPATNHPSTSPLTPSTAAGAAATTDNQDDVGEQEGLLSSETPHTSEKPRPADTASDTKDGKRNGSSGGGGGGGEAGSGSPDPFDRIGSVALTSLAGSLKILSTAVGGVGDAVFQAGMLAEGLGEGTGRVAGEGRSAVGVGLANRPQSKCFYRRCGTSTNTRYPVSNPLPFCLHPDCVASSNPTHPVFVIYLCAVFSRGYRTRGAEIRWLGSGRYREAE